MHAGDNLQEITVHEESRDMWRIYLDQQDYKNAFRHCKSQVQCLLITSLSAVVGGAAGFTIIDHSAKLVVIASI